MLYLGLMLPLIATFRQPPGRKAWFIAYTLGVTVCVLMATYQSLSLCSQITREPNVTDARFAELKALSNSASQWFEYSMPG